jgi:hypothetical protein
VTPQQQARLGEIAVWVGTAHELLRQAYAAAYGAGMLDALTVDTRVAIAQASNTTAMAARQMQTALQAQEVTHE